MSTTTTTTANTAANATANTPSNAASTVGTARSQQATGFRPIPSASSSALGSPSISSLASISPLEKLAALRRDMDRLWEFTFSGGAGAAFSSQVHGGQNIQWIPAVDLYDEVERLVARVELPGMSREQIQINYQDGVLSISGERKSDYPQGQEPDSYRAERAVGKFSRNLALPVPIETDRMSAVYKDGILTVLLPKSEDAKPHKIEVTIA